MEQILRSALRIDREQLKKGFIDIHIYWILRRRYLEPAPWRGWRRTADFPSGTPTNTLLYTQVKYAVYPSQCEYFTMRDELRTDRKKRRAWSLFPHDVSVKKLLIAYYQA